MLKNIEATEKTAVFRIIWKIPRKSRLETRINSTKNKGEGRNEFPDVKGIDTIKLQDGGYKVLWEVEMSSPT